MLISEFQQISHDLILYPRGEIPYPHLFDWTWRIFVSLKKPALNITLSCGPSIYTGLCCFFLMKFITYSGIATFSPSQGIGVCPAALLNPCKLITKFFDKTNDSKCAFNRTIILIFPYDKYFVGSKYIFYLSFLRQIGYHVSKILF